MRRRKLVVEYYKLNIGSNACLRSSGGPFAVIAGKALMRFPYYKSVDSGEVRKKILFGGVVEMQGVDKT